ncbi:MAG TPA: glycoside hydrolase family 30 beta sandwich domain-containing protein [Flavitalea sp.]|nr:glycoside hydrolase family 30 beta sandwich domain-containing protein [Flavitalea sp.]
MKQALASLLILFVIVGGCQSKAVTAAKTDAEVWLTDPGASVLFKKQASTTEFTGGKDDSANTITVDASQSFQIIDGFGYCLTGGSAMLLSQMNSSNRATLLKELFDTTGNSIGISYLRVSIGASDLDDHVFSYNDLPPGQTDINQDKFSIAEDKKFLIPILKEIVAINPAIKIMGSPWSPPAWMKTNDSTKGGSLKPEYYDSYVKYFVKYIQGMKAEGIAIDAITVQNEPLHPGNNPSLLMPAVEQAMFIKKSLGPAFKAALIRTKIIIYDHNADRPDYPISILSDADAAQYIDGSAFHLYGGTIDSLMKVHNAFPQKNLYFTEQWIGQPGNLPVDLVWNTKNIVIGAVRNWCKVSLQWNLAANSKWEPHTPGGCTECLGAITIDSNNVVRNPAYYVMAHPAKFVRPGSVRIASTEIDSLPNAAFKTPDGKKVLIVLNEGTGTKHFNIAENDKIMSTTLNGGAVATYIW